MLICVHVCCEFSVCVQCIMCIACVAFGVFTLPSASLSVCLCLGSFLTFFGLGQVSSGAMALFRSESAVLCFRRRTHGWPRFGYSYVSCLTVAGHNDSPVSFGVTCALFPSRDTVMALFCL